ncbi:hypothetical protein [Streptacidiphilus jiangxiensis]|uniref:Peptidase inhibitor family I36 n=1 Tax=Streptacidiphilus jiangxiensis TaxID=235985 RepID=A0A1H8A1Z0_STRJI|nr:hypothetical protein [Streptacidiphilus jiangxiensis]SEM63858.1 hypothetical protein SAMN05414137_13942 [Streptacidiphilus jiangxiensis]
MANWTGRLTKILAAATITVAGAVAGTGSAHAAQTAYQCRSDGYPVTNTVRIQPCYYVYDGRIMEAEIIFQNYSGTALVYCAHAVNVANGAWAHDFGCTSSGATNDYVWAGHDPGYGSSYSDWSAPAGTYVISAGFWMNGHYLGDIQSPRTTIG